MIILGLRYFGTSGLEEHLRARARAREKLALFFKAAYKFCKKSSKHCFSHIFFHHQRAENSADDSSSEDHLENVKTCRGFCSGLDISIFVKKSLIISRDQVPFRDLSTAGPSSLLAWLEITNAHGPLSPLV